MRRAVTVAVAAIMVVSVFGMTGVAFAANDTAEENSDVTPGERMSGVIGAQDAEIEGEIAERGFGISIAQAATEDAQAESVAQQLDDVEERLADLEERLTELEEARERGDISEGKFAAEVTRLEAERATAERLAAQSEAVAGELPEELLAEHGINVEYIQELRANASELTGPEVAAIAQDIAGPDVGEQLPDAAQDRIPEDRGQPDDGTPADDRAPADDRGDDVDDDEDAGEADA